MSRDFHDRGPFMGRELRPALDLTEVAPAAHADAKIRVKLANIDAGRLDRHCAIPEVAVFANIGISAIRAKPAIGAWMYSPMVAGIP